MRNRTLMIPVILAAAACTDQAVPTSPGSMKIESKFTASPRYVIKDLGVLTGGDLSGATAVNSKNVVGYATLGDGAYRAFRWSEAAGMTNLGTLPGFDHSRANGINAAGMVVGKAYRVDESRAVLWLSSDSLIDLGHLDRPGYTVATAINDRDVIVGYSLRDIGTSWKPLVTTHAFRRMPDGSKLVLSPGMDQSFAYDINKGGLMVGSAGPPGSVHAHLWTLIGTALDLGTLGGAWSEALAISDDGVVVGVSETATAEVHGFRWTLATGMIDIGLGNENFDAADANAFDRIIGNRFGGVTDGSHGYTRRGGTLQFLQGLVPDAYRTASAVNACGWIVGQARTSSGQVHAVLWHKSLCDT
jgi:probable HAF family extracellular repeat protein